MNIPNNRLGHHIKSIQALTTTVLRGARGNMGTKNPLQPEAPLVLFEMEACPYCRRVREVMTHLNLDYESRPSPHKGHVYRDELKALTAKTQVPFLIDDNTGDQIHESQDIIDHLFKHYSKKGFTPEKFCVDNDQGASVWNKAASAVSMMRGATARQPDKNLSRGRPKQLLSLYGFEASPFCRLVRETLSELEIGYINCNVAREQIQDIGLPGLRLNIGEYQPSKGGKRERIMHQVMGGQLQVPYLVDPNTNTQMFESQDIIDYLIKTYG